MYLSILHYPFNNCGYVVVYDNLQKYNNDSVDLISFLGIDGNFYTNEHTAMHRNEYLKMHKNIRAAIKFIKDKYPNAKKVYTHVPDLQRRCAFLRTFKV